MDVSPLCFFFLIHADNLLSFSFSLGLDHLPGMAM